MLEYLFHFHLLFIPPKPSFLMKNWSMHVLGRMNPRLSIALSIKCDTLSSNWVISPERIVNFNVHYLGEQDENKDVWFHFYALLCCAVLLFVLLVVVLLLLCRGPIKKMFYLVALLFSHH